MNQDDRLGPYRLLRRLGEGGMGVVHLALDPQGQQVAVKVLRSEVAGDDVARRRLSREVETMRRVRGPNIAEVVDADVTGRRPYIVTRYVPGRPLDELVKNEGPLPFDALLKVAIGVAEALAAVHAAGVIHRDLKPGNVLMLDGRPVLIDFGIAQAVDATRLTQTGMFIGTPGYLAPEIIEGHEAGPQVDVHAWAGTVLYAATGQPPFGKGTLEMIFFNITSGRANVEAAPPPIQPILRAAFNRDPAKRPTAAELVRQLTWLLPQSPGRPRVPDEVTTVPNVDEPGGRQVPEFGRPGGPPTGGVPQPGTGGAPVAGQPATTPPVPGRPVPGSPGTGWQPAAAAPVPGQPVSGQPVPGPPGTGRQPVATSPVPGQPATAAPVPGRPVPGSPVPGHPAAGPAGVVGGPATGPAPAGSPGPVGPPVAPATPPAAPSHPGGGSGEFVSLLRETPGQGGDPFPTVRVTGDDLRKAGLKPSAPPPARSDEWPTPVVRPEGDIPTRRVTSEEIRQAMTGGPAASPGAASPQQGARRQGSPQAGDAAARDRALFGNASEIYERTPQIHQPAPDPFMPTVRVPPPMAIPPGALQRSKAYGVASALLLVVMTSLAVMAPLLMCLVALPAVVLLRAADLAQPHLNSRRPAGAAAADVVRVLSRPAELAKSIGVTIALVPYALVLGLPVTLVLAVLLGHTPGLRLAALSWGVATALWTICAGPGVVGPGRQMRRTLASLAPGEGTAKGLAWGIGAFAVLTAALALSSLLGKHTAGHFWGPIDVVSVLERLKDLRNQAGNG
ncbi:MAG: protein kinase [Microbispora sp.]|nr:protein kinase [Microbispora sp.]